MVWQPCHNADAQVEAWRTPPARRGPRVFDAPCDGYIRHSVGTRVYLAEAFRTFATEWKAASWGIVAGPSVTGRGFRALRRNVCTTLDDATAWVEEQLR